MYLIYKRLVRHSHQRHISKPNIIKAKNMTDIEHPACLNPGPVMHISTAKMEVTRIPTTLELDTSAKIKHGKDTRLTN